MNDIKYFSETAEQFEEHYKNNSMLQERIELFRVYIQRYEKLINQKYACMDFGCGPGLNSILLAKKGFSVIAVDFSKKMLALAKGNINKASFNDLISYELQDLSKPSDLLDKYSGSISCIICASVIEYFEDYEKIISTIYSLLRPNGVILITFPNKQAILRRYEKIKQFFGLVKNGDYLMHQKSQFDIDATILMMKKSGFEILDYQLFNHSNNNLKSKYNANMFIIAAQKK